MAKKPTTEHQQLLTLLNPLLDYMTNNEYHFFVVAGKKGTCARYLQGEGEELIGMLKGMMEKHPKIKELITHAVLDNEQ